MFVKFIYYLRMKTELWSEREQAFRNELKSLRKQAGYSQNELASKLNKPQSFVSKYESGERQLRYQEIEVICLACGSSMSEFSASFTDKNPISL